MHLLSTGRIFFQYDFKIFFNRKHSEIKRLKNKKKNTKKKKKLQKKQKNKKTKQKTK